MKTFPRCQPTFLAYSCFIGHGSFFNALSLERLTPSINEAIKVTKIDTNHAWLPSKRVAAHLLDMCAANMGPRERGDLMSWGT